MINNKKMNKIMYQGIYVAPLQVKANKNINKDFDIFTCRWNGGLVIVTAANEEAAISLACSRTNIEPDQFQINKLPNATAKSEARILYMEIHDNGRNENG